MKKYLIYVVIAIAACLYFFLPKRPTSSAVRHQASTQVSAGDPRGNSVQSDEGFNRNANRIIYSKHARCRMACRQIDEEEVKDILQHGTVNTHKIETDNRGTTYPLEGESEGHHLRIVFAPKGSDAVEVVTCIDLDKEWPCHCN